MDALVEHSSVGPPLGQRLAAHRFTTVQLVAIDVATVTLVAVFSELYIAPKLSGATTATAATVVYAAMAAITLLRRRLPRVTLAVVLAAAVVTLALRSGVGGTVFVGMALYSVITATSRRIALVLACIAASAVLVGYIIGGGKEVVAATIGGVAVVLLGWLAGENTRTSRLYANEQVERAAERDAAARAERAEQVRRAQTDERLQIARELHDIVAHAMSVIAVRAGAARLVIDTDTAQAREGLAIIETATRDSLREMRLLVGMLREAEASGAVLSPVPGLRDLDGLISNTAAAGVTVDVTIEGDSLVLSPAADLSAYRIVQEALTNVVRHAGPTRARVKISYVHDGVEIEVVDDGPVGTAPPSRVTRPGSGHGLIGMRERAALFGGELTTGPHAGGFRVHANLPTGDLGRSDVAASPSVR